MDDSKSDNTDDLLTSIEPLIQQSEYLVKHTEYKNNKWNSNRKNNDFSFNMPVIVDDILSSRSAIGCEWKNGTIFQSPSIANIATHNSSQINDQLNSDRTISSQFYEASISSQTTPRNMSANRQPLHVVDEFGLSNQRRDIKESADSFLLKRDTHLHSDSDDIRLAYNQSRTEVQRLQLTNKQLSTQLHEAKLSIQTLTIQLEQVQQESLHKENTLANLDNTLGKLVSGWKKREDQKDQDFDSMKQDIECKDRVIEECQRIAEESRRALTNADKAVQMEKNKFEQFQKNVYVEIQNLKNERAAITKNNLELLNRCTSLEGEVKKSRDLCSERSKCIEALNFQVKEDYTSWQRENENLRKDIERMKEETVTLQFEVQCREDRLCQNKTEMKMMDDEVHRIRQDRDDKTSSLNELRSVIKKMQEDQSVALRRQEKDLQSQWHQDFNKRTLDLQDQHKRTLQSIQGNFQGKLNDQSKRHRAELERLRHVAEQEIAARMADGEETVAMLRERLERAEKSVQFWQQEKEAVEKARNQISGQLYELMASGCVPVCGQACKELVKPAFVPPKNQNLLHSMPEHFFEPIKSASTTPLSVPHSARHVSDHY